MACAYHPSTIEAQTGSSRARVQLDRLRRGVVAHPRPRERLHARQPRRLLLLQPLLLLLRGLRAQLAWQPALCVQGFKGGAQGLEVGLGDGGALGLLRGERGL